MSDAATPRGTPPDPSATTSRETETVRLGEYDNAWYEPGGTRLTRLLWFVVNAALFHSSLVPVSSVKVALLRLFGARVGRGVVIKPLVRIKYPWNLSIGDDVWIGEGVWIDNLARVHLGRDVCISQEAYLLTGNHDYKDVRFGLIVKAIRVEDGAWVGARAIVCPGVTVARNSVVAAGSVLQESTRESGIYQGNPAGHIRDRRFERRAG